MKKTSVENGNDGKRATGTEPGVVERAAGRWGGGRRGRGWRTEEGGDAHHGRGRAPRREKQVVRRTFSLGLVTGAAQVHMYLPVAI